MKTAALIKKEHIYLQETLSSQAEAFDRLAQIAYESGAAKTKQNKRSLTDWRKERLKARPALSTASPFPMQN